MKCHCVNLCVTANLADLQLMMVGSIREYSSKNEFLHKANVCMTVGLSGWCVVASGVTVHVK